MSTEKYIITKEDTNYSIIANVICQNLKDAEALGLYVYFMSLPPNWEFYKTEIRKHFGWGREKLEKKLSVLRSCNLIESVPTRDEKGKFVDWNLHVKNGREFVPIQTTENPCTGELSTDLLKNDTQYTEKPAAGNPVTGFDTPINTTSNKIYKKSFCASAQKKPTSTSTAPPKTKSAWKAENEKRHDFADNMDNAAQSKQQMANEEKHIQENEAIKYAPMPEYLRQMIKTRKYNLPVN